MASTRPYRSMYGSDWVAARYCGFRRPPQDPAGIWMHGWYPECRPLEDPDLLFGISLRGCDREVLWVATRRQEEFLLRQGFQAQAIGMPIVYQPQRDVPRTANTLLVMPAHSHPKGLHTRSEAEYVESIASLRSDFLRIVVCVSGHCWARGTWVDTFRSAGFEVIRGAYGPESFELLAKLFSQFEFVTTNSLGSLIPYAAAFGARPSLFGAFQSPRVEDLREIPFYVDRPDLLERACRFAGEPFVRETLPWLFRHPARAELAVEWSMSELGASNRVAPGELRRLFGWTPGGRLSSLARRTLSRAVRRLRPT